MGGCSRPGEPTASAHDHTAGKTPRFDTISGFPAEQSAHCIPPRLDLHRGPDRSRYPPTPDNRHAIGQLSALPADISGTL
ncbi:hypothetical protein ACWD0J_17625 [Streptomyces sp. NPDC003011]